MVAQSKPKFFAHQIHNATKSVTQFASKKAAQSAPDGIEQPQPASAASRPCGREAAEAG
ncbi:hypothetical protein OESDEN_12809 [Oesophagostomum dentatum]|uniref:Uncharacterized protein n=1 Tax=Oesophagostomum dentatum TaxID=61180 RepID=A0A0B1SQ10_OESDE|nr:hypothetical protein OESDEN_12809 [Oesophagostomum dentatum]